MGKSYSTNFLQSNLLQVRIAAIMCRTSMIRGNRVRDLFGSKHANCKLVPFVCVCHEHLGCRNLDAVGELKSHDYILLYSHNADSFITI